MRTINQVPLQPKTPLTTIKTFLHNIQYSVGKLYSSLLTKTLQIVVFLATALVASVILVYVIFLAVLSAIFNKTINNNIPK